MPRGVVFLTADPGLSDQPDHHRAERGERRRGKTRPERRQQISQRTRYGAIWKHRRITLTRVNQAPSMLPLSEQNPASIPRRVATPQPPRSSKTAKHERWRVRTGAPWRDVPDCYGHWRSVYGL